MKPTDEMVDLAANLLPGMDGVRVAGDLRSAMRDVLTAVLVLAEPDVNVIERLDMAYCVDCDLRMMRGTRHPHALMDVQVTVTAVPHAPAPTCEGCNQARRGNTWGCAIHGMAYRAAQP